MDKTRRARSNVVAVTIIATALLAGCTSIQPRVINHGPVISQDQLDLVPVGSSKDQVLLALGSPSTTGQFDTQVFYYISQKRSKTFEFQRMQLVDQKVLSVYFDDEENVSRIANYGLQDGKVFDFISRTTPTAGEDFTFLRQVLTGRASPSSVIDVVTRQPSDPSSGGF